MKKNDMLTSVGLLAGIGFVLFGILSGDKSAVKGFISPAAFAITVGGSFAAILINYPIEQVKKMGKIFAASFKTISVSNTELIQQFSNLSKKARREGLLSLEDEIDKFDDEYLRKGLQMVVDGIEPEVIKDILELEVAEMAARHKMNSGMYKSWATFAPAFGMVGTLIGLIQMLANLSDADALAVGMANALVTTFYGSLLANLFLLPFANNLEYKSNMEVSNKEMMIEGILGIQSGVNPRIVEEKLVTYLSPAEKKEYMANNGEENEVTQNV